MFVPLAWMVLSLVLGAWCLVLGAWCLVLGVHLLSHRVCITRVVLYVFMTACFMPQIHSPSCIVFDGQDNMYIAEPGNHIIRMVSSHSLMVSTFLISAHHDGRITRHLSPRQ